jgi:hypothetical protein
MTAPVPEIMDGRMRTTNFAGITLIMYENIVISSFVRVYNLMLSYCDKGIFLLKALEWQKNFYLDEHFV